MSPYAYWATIGKNPNYSYDITGQPALIWLFGWLFFAVGASAAAFSQQRSVAVPYWHYEAVNIQGALITLLIMSMIGTASVVAGVYGGIPLLAYFSGSSEVNAVNDSQASSLSGQLGLVVASNFALTMALVVFWHQLPFFNSAKRMLVLLVILEVTFQSVMAGKRQGLLMMISTLGCAFVISGKSSGVQIADLLGLTRRNRLLALGLLGILAFGVLYTFGFLAAIRSQNSETGTVDAIETATEQVVVYLQLPLINFEVQTAQAEWGPGTDNLMGPLLNLIPYKIQKDYFLDQAAWSAPPRAEPGIGSGFYGDIHWFWGFWGVVLISLCAGYVCHRLYLRAVTNATAMAIYSHLAWTLLAAHSYNHFFMLVYGVLPIGIFLAVMFLWGGWRSLRRKAGKIFNSRESNA